MTGYEYEYSNMYYVLSIVPVGIPTHNRNYRYIGTYCCVSHDLRPNFSGIFEAHGPWLFQPLRLYRSSLRDLVELCRTSCSRKDRPPPLQVKKKIDSSTLLEYESYSMSSLCYEYMKLQISGDIF